jgi:hypothetical protein
MATRRGNKGQSKAIYFELIAATERTVGKLQLRCLQTCISATPVKTGFARSGWVPSVGSPITKPYTVPKTEKGRRAAAKGQRAAAEARGRALAALYKVKLGKAFLSNNVHYVKYLNEGSSSQAGAKFVERAIEAAVRSFQGKRI